MIHRRGSFAFSLEVSAPPRVRAPLAKAAKAALGAIPLKVLRPLLRAGETYALTVSVVSDRRMQALNREFRGKDRPTDVLSFSRLEGKRFPSAEPEVGDVLIALGVAKRQARDYDATLAEELQRLAVHGILHCFGYDHERGEAAAKEMFRLQDRILRLL